MEAPDLLVDLYKRYLKSRYHLLKMNKPDIDLGLSLLEEILREQPRFALAYLAVHLGYALLGVATKEKNALAAQLPPVMDSDAAS